MKLNRSLKETEKEDDSIDDEPSRLGLIQKEKCHDSISDLHGERKRKHRRGHRGERLPYIDQRALSRTRDTHSFSCSALAVFLYTISEKKEQKTTDGRQEEERTREGKREGGTERRRERQRRRTTTRMGRI